MIRKHFPVLAFFSSILCLSLMSMQPNDEELCLPYHRTPGYIPSPLRHTDSSLLIIMAASNADPERLSEHLFNKNFDEGSLNSALSYAQNATYRYKWLKTLKSLENFGPKGLFESRKKACIYLLEQALTPPVTLNTEALNKKRD